MIAVLMPALAALALSPAAAPAQAPKPTAVMIDKEPWYLLLDLGDLEPTEAVGSRPDRKILTFANDEGVMLSVIVQKVEAPAILASCRNVFAQRKQGGHGIIPVNEVQSQQGETAYQEYDLTRLPSGKPVAQHDIFSCRARGNYYIDVHASKMPYRPADHAALMALVDGVAIVD